MNTEHSLTRHTACLCSPLTMCINCGKQDRVVPAIYWCGKSGHCECRLAHEVIPFHCTAYPRTAYSTGDREKSFVVWAMRCLLCRGIMTTAPDSIIQLNNRWKCDIFIFPLFLFIFQRMRDRLYRDVFVYIWRRASPATMTKVAHWAIKWRFHSC